MGKSGGSLAVALLSTAVTGGGTGTGRGVSVVNLGSAAKDSSRALLLGLLAQAVTEASRQMTSQVFTAASILVLVVLAFDRPPEEPRR